MNHCYYDESPMRIGVDAGGTFTDFVVLDDAGRLSTFKLRSNPADPAAVILIGLRRAANAQRGEIDVVHGSTVATNALLERKGARTALVTTAGFEDLLEIGRQNRPELYNLTPTPRDPLVPRDMCFGVEERMLHTGQANARPDSAKLAALARRILRSGARSIAICLLHAYRNPAHEKAVARALASLGLYLSTSHEIAPEIREFERASTTAVNAYVGPLMDQYLSKLDGVRPFRIAIMQSNGGYLSARDARRHAVRTVLSGPAGGAIGAAAVARASGQRRVLGFDMGGTSTDVCLSDQAPHETTEAVIDGMPLRVPMLDIHTVGAGGGSLARIDAGGLLRVGPESAGADPGPACYGDGTKPTVTDAHVVLGRISSLLGGEMTVDAERAKAAIEPLARSLKLDTTQAAAGILRVANANMVRAIRAVSVERGYDPRDFALVAFGGSGGLHACDIAADLGITTVLVPQHAGVLSALGMLLADAVRDYAAGVLGQADPTLSFASLERRALRESPAAKIERSTDLRYVGQSYEINVPFTTWKRAVAHFHREHERLYGYALPDRIVEAVTIRVRARLASPRVRLKRVSGKPAESEMRHVWIDGDWRKTPVHYRQAVGVKPQRGPALVLDYGSTTVIPPGWSYRLDTRGTLVLRAGKFAS